jgi:hypothetical protein
MPRTWWIRFQALLLALLVLGGGGRLPVLDGIVFHAQPGSIPSGTSLVAGDAVAPHGAADHLVSGVPATGPLPQAEGGVRALPGVDDADGFPRAAAPRTHRPDPIAQPRAPPSPV